MNQRFDYIITGGGLAGLSLLHHLFKSDLTDKRILLIDQERKEQNDRTWCFWEAEAGPFEDVVCQTWHKIAFYTYDFETELDIAPFAYKMIRGIDFYEKMQAEMDEAENLTVYYGRVEQLEQEQDGVRVRLTDGEVFEGDWVFNSIFFGKIDKERYNYVDQHFKGWVIRSEEAVFDPALPTFMDFRYPQEGEARFFYVLPTDAHSALVELAIFSNDIWPEVRYDRAIKDYIRQHITAKPYVIEHQEVGVIPMTDYPFTRTEGRIMHLGTAGGHTKPSTGYTFWRLQQYLRALVSKLERTGDPRLQQPFYPARYAIFDSTLLNVLLHNRVPSDHVFADLFRKNPPQRVLKFLNEETSLSEDLQIMNSVPIGPFMLAFGEEVVKKVKRRHY